MAANFGSLPQKSRAARSSVDGSAPCVAAHSIAMSKNRDSFAAANHLPLSPRGSIRSRSTVYRSLVRTYPDRDHRRTGRTQARHREPVLTSTTLPGDPADKQARYIEAAVEGILVCCLYLPNGNPSQGR